MGVSARALRAGRAIIELSLLSGPVEKKLQVLQHQVRAVGQTFAKFGQIGAGMAAAILGPLGATIKLASDAQEGLNKFRSVFNDQADAAEAFASRLASSVGRSKTEIRDALSSFQGFFVGLGFAPDKARELSQQMESLALDFASFHNLSDQEAIERFISALSGSSEVLDRFGINTKQAALQQELLKEGIGKTWTEVTESEKAIARLNVIMQAMTAQGAMGDAFKTAGSFANQLKALKARVVDIAVEIGGTLLPVATKWLEQVRQLASRVATWVSKNNELFVSLATTAVKVMGVSAGLIALGKIITGVSIAVKGLQTAIVLLSAHPIAALVTVLGAAVLAAAHFSGVLQPLYDWLRKIATGGNVATNTVDKLSAALDRAADKTATLTIEEQIAEKQREMSAYAAHPKTLAKLREEMKELEKRRDLYAKSAQEQQAAPGNLQAEAARRFNNFVGMLPGSLQATITGAQLPPAIENVLKSLGSKIAELSNMSAVQEIDVTDAIRNLKALGAKGGGLSRAREANRPIGTFDTRLIRQMAGAGNKEDTELLRKIEKNTGARNDRSGIPVI